jgi:hypothetical protein
MENILMKQKDMVDLNPLIWLWFSSMVVDTPVTYWPKIKLLTLHCVL